MSNLKECLKGFCSNISGLRARVDSLESNGTGGSSTTVLVDGLTVIGNGTAGDVLRSPLSLDQGQTLSAGSDGFRYNQHLTRPVSRVVWLSPNAYWNGIDGNGTEGLPFDASTQPKLDAIYAAYPDNVVFKYLPGTFETNGWQFNSIENGGNNTSHIGSGMGVTTLKLVNATGASGSTDGVIIGTNFTTVVTNVLIEGLTLDVNAPANPAFTGGLGALGAVRLYGDNIRVIDCEVTGFGTSSPAECFPVIVGRSRDIAEDPSLGANRVKGCVFHNPATGNVGPLTCVLLGTDGLGNALGLTAKTDVVENCSFYNINRADTGFSVCHGVAAPIVRDCVFNGMEDCLYWEPQGPPAQDDRVDYGNLIAQNNTFIDYRFAITIRQSSPTAPTRLLRVDGNTFLSREGNNRTESAFTMVTATTNIANTIQRLVIENNYVGHESGVVQPAAASGTNFMYLVAELGGTVFAQNVVIRDNIIDLRNHENLTLNEIPGPATSLTNQTIDRNIMSDGTNVDAFLSMTSI